MQRSDMSRSINCTGETKRKYFVYRLHIHLFIFFRNMKMFLFISEVIEDNFSFVLT